MGETTLSSNFLDLYPKLVRHEPDNACRQFSIRINIFYYLSILSTEDDEASKDWGDTVAHGNHDGVPEDVVPEVVVGGQGDHSPPGHSQGEEDLDTGVSPHLIIYILEIFVKK